ncbi:MAG TPA: glycosyltransferase [Candidatus Limnocylindrales bacterium]|nr:glycosyltransferase [Candidatus Limnocylindrales bacterium]
MTTRSRRRGHLPAPDTPGRLMLIRIVAVLALAATAVYLAWRATATMNVDAWFLSVPMLAFEVHAAIGLGLFTFSLWDVDVRPRRRALGRVPSVAVLIPTFNEGPEILVPTIAAAVALEPMHETWVLDDGERPEIAELAASLGARYLARPTHEHAKAGNVNYALGIVDAEILAFLDADHVAAPDFLRATLGYFADPRVALVQTPQDFYNVTSFEHGSGIAYGEPFHEQTLFYRLLQPGKNRWNAAFWCGTSALVRAEALRAVGGAATDTITEDIHTTIRLHRAGWRTVYHNEVLARGLAADDAGQYQLQRNRWGTGAMQVLRLENPLTVSGLTLGQRLGYAATLLGWFDSWRTLGFLLLPPLVLVSGRIPIIADGLTFAVAFGVTYALQQAALYLLGRGAYRPIVSIVFDLVRMSPNFIATLTLFTSRKPRFRVTPKGRMAANRGRIEAPTMLRAALGACFVGATVYVLHLLNVFSIPYASEWAAAGAFGWLVVNAALVWVAARRVRSLRFAAERRSAVRFAVDIPGSVDGVTASVHDVSVGGALLATPEPLVERETHLVSFELPGGTTSLWARIRSSRRAASGEHHYALEFEPGQYPAKGALARTVFVGRYPVAGTVRQSWSDLLRREIGPLSRRFQLGGASTTAAADRPVSAAA